MSKLSFYIGMYNSLKGQRWSDAIAQGNSGWKIGMCEATLFLWSESEQVGFDTTQDLTCKALIKQVARHSIMQQRKVTKM